MILRVGEGARPSSLMPGIARILHRHPVGAVQALLLWGGLCPVRDSERGSGTPLPT